METLVHEAQLRGRRLEAFVLWSSLVPEDPAGAALLRLFAETGADARDVASFDAFVESLDLPACLEWSRLEARSRDELHVHVYGFQGQTLAIKRRFAERFGPLAWKNHVGAVGPHPEPMMETCLRVADREAAREIARSFAGRASFFVHEATENDLRDHTVLGEWVGEPIKLKFAHFGRYARAQLVKRRETSPSSGAR